MVVSSKITEKILNLKQERNAVILAHNYQLGEIQDIPDIGVGGPMANMITAKRLRVKKKEYPNAIVVCYVNSSADVKGESDVCCTSANAVNVVQKFADNREIIFVPDQYLGHYVSTKTNKKLILWP